MTVSGDLSTIDLADLLQNIEAHGRTGTMTLRSETEEAQLFFRAGKVALLARPNRMPFVDLLVATGQISAKRLDAARKRQRGSRRSVLELLVGARVLPLANLRELAEHRLGEDVANLIAGATGEFKFVEHDTPGPGFDRDEAALQLALAVAPLVLEATRRVDDWAEIRKFVPTTAIHFRARDGASPPRDIEDQDTAAELLGLLDGTRSAEETIELFSEQRFLAHKLLATFVRERTARPVDCNELLAFANDREGDDPARARVLVRRALDTEPHHAGLLAAEARLAEQLDDKDAAVAAHKLLAHLHVEAGRTEDAHAALAAGQRLAPQDPSLWERSLQLAIAQGRREDALHDGMHLVALHRAPGLHQRAKQVLEQLLTFAPEQDALHVEFARSCVDCGDAPAAVRHLQLRGKELIAQTDYESARVLFEEILAIDPGHAEAAVSIEMIDRHEFMRRRERRRRIVHRFALAIATAAVTWGAFVEIKARVACVALRSLISRERLIEKGMYADAIALWQHLRSEHAFAPIAWFEIPAQIEDLVERRDEANSWPASGR